MLLPAALFGYLIVFFELQKANEVLRHVPRGPAISHYMAEVLEADAFRVGGFLLEWILYCFAFSGIAVAVRKLIEGECPVAEECFTPVREKVGPLIGLSLVLALLMVIAFAVLEAVATFLYLGFIDSLRAFWMVWPLCVVFLTSLAVARFGSALPALILDNCVVCQSLIRSFKLTKGNWTILALLVLESVGGSYVIYQLVATLVKMPVVHRFAPEEIRWATVALSLIMGILLQPPMLIGFSLLYIRRSQRSQVLLAEPPSGLVERP